MRSSVIPISNNCGRVLSNLATAQWTVSPIDKIAINARADLPIPKERPLYVTVHFTWDQIEFDMSINVVIYFLMRIVIE